MFGTPTTEQLQGAATVQRLTTLLKRCSVLCTQQRSSSSIESVRMYSSMLLVLLASSLGESVLQVNCSNVLLHLESSASSLAINSQLFAAHLGTQQHSTYLRCDQRSIFS
jgi:hypothetical protein